MKSSLAARRLELAASRLRNHAVSVGKRQAAANICGDPPMRTSESKKHQYPLSDVRDPAPHLRKRTSKNKGYEQAYDASAAFFDLKFLLEFAAGDAGISNRRHQQVYVSSAVFEFEVPMMGLQQLIGTSNSPRWAILSTDWNE